MDLPAPVPPFRSRLAPTPSGYLHLGNAWNFGLTWLLTRRAGGRLRLRIDDLDAPRVRPAYVEDIFRTLEWLGLDWDEGPTGPEDHARNYSQQDRHARYEALITQLGERVFACGCSRRAIEAASPDGQYPGTCRRRGLPLDQPGTALRVQTADAAVTWTDGWQGPVTRWPDQAMRDPVIRRKDGIPAYQIASLADDLDHGITHILRGADLLDSTAIQLWLAEVAGEPRFGQVQFYHHPLLTDATGHKLSKSAGSAALAHQREAGHPPTEVWTQLAAWLGWPIAPRSAQELLALPADQCPLPP